MSRYVVLLDGGRREEAVEVVPAAPGRYEVRVGGRVHQVDAFQHDHGTLSLLVDGRSWSVQLDARDGRVAVQLGGAVHPLEVLDERRLRLRRGGRDLAPAGKQTVTAPIAGRVARVLVKVGDQVKAGQGLVVVEAMKMENELRSPKDGQVVELHVQEGQAVEAHARLAAVE